MATGDLPVQSAIDAPEGARCAEHPLDAASRICRRCGNYMCAFCAGSGAHAECRVCRARLGGEAFPFTRDNWTIEGVCAYSFALWKKHWVPLAGVSGLCLAASWGMSFATNLVQLLLPEDTDDAATAIVIVVAITFVVQILVQSWTQLAMQAVSLELIRTGRVDMQVALQSIVRVPHLVLQFLAAYVPFVVVAAIAIGTVFALGMEKRLDDLLMPALWASPVVIAASVYYLSGLMFMQLALVDRPPLGALSGIEQSMRLAWGQRMRLLVMGFIMGTTVLAGMLACCVGIVFSVGLANLMFASLYLAVKADGPAAPVAQMPAS